MKKALFFLLVFYSASAWASYRYSYIPKPFSPTIYNILYDKREKCSAGEKKEYSKQAGVKGVCASCPEGTVYMIDETLNKALCFKCPEGTLPVKRNGYPMCLSSYPVINGKALNANGETVPDEDIKRMAVRLSAEYKTNPEKTSKKSEKTFNNKEKLKNVCPSSYPEDETAQKQIDICRRLVSQNDFLCPYVEKNGEGKWTCRACPKNAPYKNEQGGCFNCPYGEEMFSLEDGKLVCASEAPGGFHPKEQRKIKSRKKIRKKQRISGATNPQ